MPKGGSPSPTKRSRRRRLAALFVAAPVVLSAAGLAALSLHATGAVEDRARLNAMEALASAELALSAAADALLAEADAAAAAWRPEDPPSPLLDGVFLVSAEGEIRLPVRERYPPLPPPPAEAAAEVARFLEAARAEAAAGGDPLRATAFLETPLVEYPHPDLAGSLLDLAARIYLDGGLPDRALYLSQEIADHLPAARSLEGEPLAPTAHLRILRILGEAGREEELREAARVFAARLADRAFGLPRYERDVMLERAAQALGPAGLPPETAARADFLDALTDRVIPEAEGRLAGDSPAEQGRWRRTLRAGPAGPEVFGHRILETSGGPHIFGYRVAREALHERLARAAEDVAARSGISVAIDLRPPVVAGAALPAGALRRPARLPGALGSVDARLAAPAPAGAGLLRTVHLLTTAGLVFGLAAGALLAGRAIRREIALARLRRKLVDDVSHELRTPLTTIRMHAEMLAEEDLPEEVRRRYLGHVLRESEQLSRLVSDVLDLSRIDRGESAGPAAAVPAGEIVAESVARIAPVAAAAGTPVRVDAPPLPPALVHRDGAVRALVNLLANAVKYSPRGEEVTVSGAREGDRVVLTVADRGPGVDPAAREHLFERFYRAPRDAARMNGAGVGLALAREFARSHGGDVVLVDTSPTGSRFALVLPAAKEAGS